MGRYKITYTYIDYSSSIHGQRVRSYDEYEADSAQDAVDQCREDFYIANELDIKEVSKWSFLGYWLPVFDNAWM